MNNFARIISKWKALCLCLALTHAGHSMDDEQKSDFKSRLAFFEKKPSNSSYGCMSRKETSNLPKKKNKLRPQEKTSIPTDTRGDKPMSFAFSDQGGIDEDLLALKMTQTRINIPKEERAANLEEKRQKSLSYARNIGCAVEETASYKEIQDAITKRKQQQQQEKEEREEKRQKSLSYARNIGCAVEETASYKEIQDAITKRKQQQQRERDEQRQEKYLEKLIEDAQDLGISCSETTTSYSVVPIFGIEDIDTLKGMIRAKKQEQYDQRQKQYAKKLLDDCTRLGIDVVGCTEDSLSASYIEYLKTRRQRIYDERRREKAISLGLPSYASSDEINEVVSESRREYREERDRDKREKEARKVSSREERMSYLEKKVAQDRSLGARVSYKECLEIRNFYSQSSCTASSGERCGCNCCIGY